MEKPGTSPPVWLEPETLALPSPFMDGFVQIVLAKLTPTELQEMLFLILKPRALFLV